MSIDIEGQCIATGIDNPSAIGVRDVVATTKHNHTLASCQNACNNHTQMLVRRFKRLAQQHIAQIDDSQMFQPCRTKAGQATPDLGWCQRRTHPPTITPHTLILWAADDYHMSIF